MLPCPCDLCTLSRWLLVEEKGIHSKRLEVCVYCIIKLDSLDKCKGQKIIKLTV